MKKRTLGQKELKELGKAMLDIERECEQGKAGAFGLESKAFAQAREFERSLLREEIEKHDRGYEGNTRRCPRCGKKTQQYKGDAERVVEFHCGELSIKRAYYVCCECGHSSYPLDDKLGLVSGKEQGRLRKMLSMLSVVVPYNQAPQVCETMFGNERHAASMRRLLLRESKRLENDAVGVEKKLNYVAGETVYIQIDGHMCPTREVRQTPEDQGFREAKAVLAYCNLDTSEPPEKRRILGDKILKAKIATAEEFRPIVCEVYQRAGGARAETVVFLADGAKWIWNIAEEVAPEAVQILDYAHAKQYLYEYANIRFAGQAQRVRPWVVEQQDKLCNDKVMDVIAEMKLYADLNERLAKIARYFENNASRMLYGTFKARGLTIGSGAIESAGKQLAISRVKGPGMRWNVVDLNPLLAMRAAFIDGDWSTYWKRQELLAA